MVRPVALPILMSPPVTVIKPGVLLPAVGDRAVMVAFEICAESLPLMVILPPVALRAPPVTDEIVPLREILPPLAVSSPPVMLEVLVPLTVMFPALLAVSFALLEIWAELVPLIVIWPPSA